MNSMISTVLVFMLRGEPARDDYVVIRATPT
jgi:hypothetical protein